MIVAVADSEQKQWLLKNQLQELLLLRLQWLLRWAEDSASISGEGAVIAAVADSKQKQLLLQIQLQELVLLRLQWLLRWHGAVSGIRNRTLQLSPTIHYSPFTIHWPELCPGSETILCECFLWRICDSCCCWFETDTLTVTVNWSSVRDQQQHLQQPRTPHSTIHHSLYITSQHPPHQYPSLRISCTFTVPVTYTVQWQTLWLFPVTELW